MRIRLVPVAVAIALAVLLAPGTLLGIVFPDAAAAPSVQRLLPDAKQFLASRLELTWAHVRYAGAELRASDNLVILHFELRPFPFVAPEGAYLMSRCTPLVELDPMLMGGGRGVTDPDADLELRSARSDAQPCE